MLRCLFIVLVQAGGWRGDQRYVIGRGCICHRFLMPLLQGWDEGVAGMKVGGERLLIVPPSLGYGKRKMGDIPSNSTLRFGEPIGCPLGFFHLELTASCQRSNSSTSSECTTIRLFRADLRRLFTYIKRPSSSVDALDQGLISDWCPEIPLSHIHHKRADL
jgi:hypothetical protein